MTTTAHIYDRLCVACSDAVTADAHGVLRDDAGSAECVAGGAHDAAPAAPALISEDDFESIYRSMPDAKGEVVRHNPPQGVSADRVWTVVEGDDGNLYALAGLHMVNRFGWVLTEVPWPSEDAEAVWHIFEPECARCHRPVEADAAGVLVDDTGGDVCEDDLPHCLDADD